MKKMLSRWAGEQEWEERDNEKEVDLEKYEVDKIYVAEYKVVEEVEGND